MRRSLIRRCRKIALFVLPITVLRASLPYTERREFQRTKIISQTSKVLGWPSTRNVVEWLRYIASYEALVLGAPELSHVSCRAGQGRHFWQS